MKKNLFYHPGTDRLFTSIEIKTIEPTLGVNSSDGVLKNYGLHRLVQTSIPSVEPDEMVEELKPELGEDGLYRRRFEVRDIFEDLDEESRSAARRDFLTSFFQKEKEEKIQAIRKSTKVKLKKGFQSNTGVLYGFEVESDLSACLTHLQLQPDKNEFYLRSKTEEVHVVTAEELRKLGWEMLLAKEEILKAEKQLIEELENPKDANEGRFSQVKELFEKIKQLPKEDLE
jgi:DNA mismatch repair ATPase MutS